MKGVWQVALDGTVYEEDRPDRSACPIKSLKIIYPTIQTVIRPGQLQGKTHKMSPRDSYGIQHHVFLINLPLDTVVILLYTITGN